MTTRVSTCLVDHHPSVVKNLFPKEALIKIQSHYDILDGREIEKILGEKETQQFKASLRNNIFPQGYFMDEFHKPVVSLYYYKNVEEAQSETNRNALRSHGASHGTIDAQLHPEYRHLWNRIIEMVNDLVFPDNPKESAKSIRNNQLIITSLLPIEELKATYLKDLPLADRERKKQLLKFKDINFHELEEGEQIFYWPYVTACKSYNLLHKRLKFSKQEIENLIKTCNFKTSIYEIRQTEDWTKDEDVHLSNLPYFINILDNAEKIAQENTKNRGEVIEEIMRKPKKISCINITPSLRVPESENTNEKMFEKSLDIWKISKLIRILGALQEGETAEAALYDISEHITSSTIVTYGTTNNWTHEVLIPKPRNHKEQIFKMVLKIKFLLLIVNPTFNYKTKPHKGDKIRAYDEEIIFPKIEPKKIDTIEKTLETKEDTCKEIQKELENYAKTSKLKQRMETALNQTTTPQNTTH